jgi:hypothetical protein
MRTKFTVFLVYLLLSFSQLHAQTLLSPGIHPINNLGPRTAVFSGMGGLGKTSNCSTDTVNYTWNKTTALNTISLNNATSGNAFAQWYPAPQAITVHGFEFYAWVTTMNSAVVTLTCRLYNAGIDSMPVGSALATTTINVDSTFGGGVLTALRKKAIFSTPVTTSNPNGYVLAIETSSSVNVAVVANSWTAAPANGRFEWLSSVRIGTTYNRSYNINIGGVTFNADFIMQPFVSYNLTANFTSSASCMVPATAFTFTNTSSPVLFNKFYNVRAFFGTPQFSCVWDYGDSTGSYYAVNGSRIFNYNATYKVKLTDTLIGWMSGCGDSYTREIYQTPSPTIASNNSPICSGGTLRLFADSVPGATYAWTGPNGFTSNQRNPEISGAGIAATGLYSVTAVIGQCSSSVATTYATVINSYNAGNNGPLCAGQNLSLNATEITGATYSWTGPNGFTSSSRNALRSSVTKADSGLYSVNISAPGCGVLGSFNTLVIVNNIPATPTASSNGPVCVGQTLNLSASGITGGYNWVGPNNFSSNTQNPVRLSSQLTFAGTYSVTLTANGCTSNPGSVNVVVNSIPTAPTAGNNGPLCSGQTLSLSASLIPNASYNWSGPNSFVSNLQNPTRTGLTLLDAGLYSVIATVNGCPSAVVTTSVVITSTTPAPTVSGNGPLCPGQNLQLTATGTAGATYSWSGPNNFSSSQQNPGINNVNDSNAGIYSVTASTTACGTSSAATYTLVVNTLPPAPSLGNNGPICEGQNLNLTAASITGASYSWTGPQGFSSTSQNPSITNMTKAKAGTYTAFVTVTGCGTSPTSTTTVVVRSVPNAPITSSNSPVCIGDTIRLNAAQTSVGPNATYHWSGPNNFSSDNKQTSINSALSGDGGIYSVTVSDSGCVSSLGSVSVQVRSLPASPLASSNSPICAGANLNLQAGTVSGASYQWQGPESFVSTSQNPIVTSTAVKNSGTYSVRSFVNGCGSIPATVNVLINALPAEPVASNTGPGCVGDNITLRASNIIGATYNWSGPGFTSTLQNPILVNVSKSMSGSYAVSASVSGCTSTEAKTDVVINSIPAAPTLSSNPSTAACTGDSLRFYASNVSNGVFEWNGPLGFTSNSQNPVLFINNTAQGGAYNAKVTQLGCTSATATINIQVHASPNTSSINGLTDVRSGENQSYSVTSTAGSTYDWQITGGSIQSGLGTSSVTVIWGAKGNGSITLTETNAAGCKGIKQNKAVNIGPPTGLKEAANQLSVVMYPNPSNGNVFIHFTEPVQSIEALVITDVSGRIVKKYTGTINPSIDWQINLSELGSGLYFVQLRANGKECTKSIAIQGN